MNAMIIMSL